MRPRKIGPSERTPVVDEARSCTSRLKAGSLRTSRISGCHNANGRRDLDHARTPAARARARVRRSTPPTERAHVRRRSVPSSPARRRISARAPARLVAIEQRPWHDAPEARIVFRKRRDTSLDRAAIAERERRRQRDVAQRRFQPGEAEAAVHLGERGREVPRRQVRTGEETCERNRERIDGSRVLELIDRVLRAPAESRKIPRDSARRCAISCRS